MSQEAFNLKYSYHVTKLKAIRELLRFEQGEIQKLFDAIPEGTPGLTWTEDDEKITEVDLVGQAIDDDIAPGVQDLNDAISRLGGKDEDEDEE